MKGLRRLAGLAVVAALGLMLGNVTHAKPQAAAAAGGQDAAKPQYTMAEYNAYTAGAGDERPDGAGQSARRLCREVPEFGVC